MWSILACFILAIWQYGILAAGATSFPVSYTPGELPGVIWDAGSRAWWPGEFGRASRWWMRIEQVAPFVAAAVWCLCLVPWRTRRARILAVVVTALAPGWPIVYTRPDALVFWPFSLPVGLLLPWSGEEYQDGIISLPAMAVWWWFMLALFVLNMLRRDAVRPECAKCGYSTIGLTSGVCPECGSTVPSSVLPRAGSSA